MSDTPSELSSPAEVVDMPHDLQTSTPARELTINSSLADLQTEEQCRVLDTVAKVRKCGLDGDLSLPQLVVCGDQSAGKSSLLEALTEIPFPRSEGLGTRFATEIILRRANANSLKVKVIPAADRSAAEKAVIKAFQLSITDFKELGAVIKAAKTVMGVSDPDTKAAKTVMGVPGPDTKAFAKDILSIEIEGPTRPQLTLVDIPGLIATSTKGVTTQDVNMVAEITNNYISKPRTICLAVVSAANDYANQKILEKVREFDKGGNRTLGIITKPDRIEGSGSKAAFLELAQNKDIQFNLGWHVLKNRSADESAISLEERKNSETKWFREDPFFRDLPLDRVGIDTLRRRLSILLFDHVKRELPKLRAELNVALKETRGTLNMMGNSRSSTTECRDYLSQLSIDYQGICKAAVDGHYEDSYFRGGDCPADSNPSPSQLRRTRAIVQRLNTEFSDHLHDNGHKYHIDKSDDYGSEAEEDSGPDESSYEPIPMSRPEAIKWVHNLMVESRGKELVGNFNPLLIGELFWAQSTKWEQMASDHVEKVAGVCEDFLSTLLKDKCPEDVEARVWELIDDNLTKRRSEAENELAKIMLDITSYPINYNHYYTDTINKRRQERQQALLTKSIKAATTKKIIDEKHRTSIDVEKVTTSYYQESDADMEKFACEEALDCLHAIYKVSQKTFIANITTQVIERHIVRNLDDIFSPLFVSRLNDKDVESIAAEPVDAQRERARLQDKMAKLKEGHDAFKSVMGVSLH